MTDQTPWKNGFYINPTDMTMIIRVNGNDVDYLSTVALDFPDMDPYYKAKWTFGDFGEARQEVKDAAGGKVANYNVEIVVDGGMFTMKGILSEDGSKIITWGFSNDVETIQFLSDEDYEKLKNDREHMNECSVPYPLNPGKPGKIVWLSGPPGAGKSTSGQLLAKKAGYAYYEADCVFSFLNPFVPLDVDNPTLAAGKQKPLRGFPKSSVDAILQTKPLIEAMMQGTVTSEQFDTLIPFMILMAKDIKVQQARIGGDFAVAFAVPSKKERDLIREHIPDIIFVALEMTTETIEKRLKGRHGDMPGDVLKGFVSMASIYKGPEEGEKNTYSVEITEGMNRDDVLGKILEKLK